MIDKYSLCDGRYQCSDRSDEENCQEQKYQEEDVKVKLTNLKNCIFHNDYFDVPGFVCGTKCLPMQYWCDPLSTKFPFYRVNKLRLF